MTLCFCAAMTKARRNLLRAPAVIAHIARDCMAETVWVDSQQFLGLTVTLALKNLFRNTGVMVSQGLRFSRQYFLTAGLF